MVYEEAYTVDTYESTVNESGYSCINTSTCHPNAQYPNGTWVMGAGGDLCIVKSHGTFTKRENWYCCFVNTTSRNCVNIADNAKF